MKLTKRKLLGIFLCFLFCFSAFFSVFLLLEGNNDKISKTKIEVPYRFTNDIRVNSSITSSLLENHNLIITLHNPDEEKIWVDCKNFNDQRVFLNKSIVVIHGYQPEMLFTVHVGDDSDEYEFGESGPYDYTFFSAPENSFGMNNFTTKEVNWSYFWSLFNEYSAWDLQAQIYNQTNVSQFWSLMNEYTDEQLFVNNSGEWIDWTSHLSTEKEKSKKNYSLSSNMSFTSSSQGVTDYVYLFRINRAVLDTYAVDAYTQHLNFTGAEGGLVELDINYSTALTSDYSSIMDGVSYTKGTTVDDYLYLRIKFEKVDASTLVECDRIINVLIRNLDYEKEWYSEYEGLDIASWLDIDKKRSLDNSSEKVTLNLTNNAPIDMRFRYTFGIDARVSEYVNKTSHYEYTLTYPIANTSENYTVFFNWSDLVSMIENNSIQVKHGVQNVSERDVFWFRIITNNELLSGQSYSVDPSFGSEYGDSGLLLMRNYQRGLEITTSGSGDFTQIVAKCKTLGMPANAMAMLYDSSYNLVQSSGAETITTSTSPTTFDITDTSFTDGQTYYITVFSDGISSQLFGTAISGSETVVGETDTYAGGPESNTGGWDSSLSGDAYIYIDYTGNTAPTMDSFNVDADDGCINGYDGDNDDAQIDWSTTDADSDPVTVYITFNVGSVARTPTTAEGGYDYHASVADVSNRDCNWEDNVASWTEGSNTVYFKARCHDGTEYSNTLSDTIPGIDSSNPSTPGSVSINSGASWDTDGTLSCTWTASTDTASGISGYYAEAMTSAGTPDEWVGNTLSDTDGTTDGTTRYYRVMAKDNAGRTSTVGSDTIGVDRVAPALPDTVQCRPDGYADTGEWDDDTTIYITYGTATDATSGIAYVYGEFADSVPDVSVGNDGQDSTSTSVSEGSNTYYVKAVDNAGHSSTVRSDTISVDLTSPDTSVDVVDPDPGNPESITGGSTDGGSGISDVKIQVHDTDDDDYWTGSEWGDDTWISVTPDDGNFNGASEDWTYDSSGISWDSSHSITISVKSYDNVNREDGEPATDDFTTESSWSNTAPTITADSENPVNESTEVGLSLVGNYSHFNITVADIDNEHPQKINVTWRTNETGTWKDFAYNESDECNSTFYAIDNVSWVDEYNHKYWWSVNVSDNASAPGWVNQTFHFATIDYTPDAPVLTSATALGTTSVQLSWTDDDEADTTYIEWDSVNDTSWNRGDHNDTGINSSSSPQTHSGLTASTTYYYKAWSYNETQGVWSEGSNRLDNTTDEGWSNTAPTIEEQSPTGAGIGLNTDLSVKVNDTDGNESTIYWKIDTDNDVNDTSIVHTNTTIVNQTVYYNTSTEINSYSATYYVGCWANDTHDNTSLFWSFTTKANTNPTVSNENPTNESTNVGLSLSGNSSHFNITINDADGHLMDITWSTNESGSWKEMGTNTTGGNGTYYCTNISWVDTSNTKYWWNVSVNDSYNGWVNETYSFTTIDYTPDPPSGFEAETIDRFQIDLNWTNATEKSDKVYIEYKTDSNDSDWNIGDQTKIDADGYIESNTFSHTGLTNGTTYYYAIWSHNNTQNVNSSTARFISNTTDSNNAPTASLVAPANNSEQSSTSVTLQVSVSDTDSDSVDVEFHNKSDDSLIGTDTNVANGGTASTTWTGLGWDTISNQWYVTVSDDYAGVTNQSATYYNFSIGSEVFLSVTNPFPAQNSQSVLTGINNLSVIINCSDSWNISLYKNNTDGSLGNLVAYNNGSNSLNTVQYCDVSNALYYKFSQNYTWFVNATDGTHWDNNTYYFTTFNGSGYIYKDKNTSAFNKIYDIKTYGDYVFASAYDEGLLVFKIVNSSLEFVTSKDDARVMKLYVGEYQYLDGISIFTVGGDFKNVLVYTFDENNTEELWLKGNTSAFSSVCVHSNEEFVFYGKADGEYDNITAYTFNESGLNSWSFKNESELTGIFSTTAVTSINDYIIVSKGTDGIHLLSFNASGNEAFSFIDSYDDDSYYRLLTANDDYVYAPAGINGIQVFSVNNTDLALKYTHDDGGTYYGVSISGLYEHVAVYDEGGKAYAFDGGDFFIFDAEPVADGESYYWYCAGTGPYVLFSSYNSGLFLYGFELLRVAPPVIDLVIAGNPSKDISSSSGISRYLNNSYNNETWCNITANISVPTYRTMGRYFRTTDDDVFIPTGDLSDSDDGGWVWTDESNKSLIASQWECTFTGEYSQISAFIIGEGTYQSNISYAVYSDSGGTPGNLIGYTEIGVPDDSFTDDEGNPEVRFPETTRVWHTLDIAYDSNGDSADYVSLTQGTSYWLVMAHDDNDSHHWNPDNWFLLGNSLGDTCHVKTAPYNISKNMNYSSEISDVSGLSWADHDTAHYACIYAIADSTYNDNIQTVDIASATVHWYNDSSNTWNVSMSEMTDGNWTTNITGLSSGTWYTFDIVGYDELNDEITYEHMRFIGTDTEYIEFQCGVANDWTDSNSSTDLYNSNYVMYLWNATYATDTYYGDDEHQEDALVHEQGVDGTSRDTGYWRAVLPGETFQERGCLQFAGGWWDENITIESDLAINEVYYKMYVGVGGLNETSYNNYDRADWNKNYIHFGRMSTLYDFTYLEQLGDTGYWEEYPLDLNSSTVGFIDLDGNFEPKEDPIGGLSSAEDDHRIISGIINVSSVMDDDTYDSNSIYNMFFGLNCRANFSWNQKSMIMNNRSYLSYIIINPPDNSTLYGLDSDGDGLSDHHELYNLSTHPFLVDTDGDGYNDSDDSNPNDYTSHIFTIDNEQPTNNSNVEYSLAELTVDITGSGSYDWNITCSNGDTNSSTDDSSGTKDLQLVTPLVNGTTYTWWVNVTDGINIVNKTYYFTVQSLPELTNPSVFPTSGIASYTTFYYNVTWTDSVDDPSDGYLSVNISIDGGAYYNESMTWASGDNSTGAIYTYSRTLTASSHWNYTFHANDGSGYNSSGPYNNPTVSSQSLSFTITTSSNGDRFHFRDWTLSITGVGLTTEYNVSEDNQTADIPALNISNTGNVPLNFSINWTANPGSGITMKYATSNTPPNPGTNSVAVDPSSTQIITNLPISQYEEIWLWLDFVSVASQDDSGNIKVWSELYNG